MTGMGNMQNPKKELQEQVSGLRADVRHQKVVQDMEPREILGGRRDIMGAGG